MDADISKIREFYLRGFHPNNADLICAGGLPGNSDELIKRYFGEIPMGKDSRIIFPELAPLEKKMQTYLVRPHRLQGDSLEKSSASVHLRCVAPCDRPDRFALISALEILGSPDLSSRLIRSIGCKLGLAYNVSTNYNDRYNAGCFAVNADVPARRIDEAVSAIFDEMDLMKTEAVSEEELRVLKSRTKYCFAKQQDSNEDLVAFLENLIRFKRSVEEAESAYEKVTSKDILAATGKHFPDRESGKYMLTIASSMESDASRPNFLTNKDFD